MQADCTYSFYKPLAVVFSSLFPVDKFSLVNRVLNIHEAILTQLFNFSPPFEHSGVQVGDELADFPAHALCQKRLESFAA